MPAEGPESGAVPPETAAEAALAVRYASAPAPASIATCGAEP